MNRSISFTAEPASCIFVSVPIIASDGQVSPSTISDEFAFARGVWHLIARKAFSTGCFGRSGSPKTSFGPQGAFAETNFPPDL